MLVNMFYMKKNSIHDTMYLLGSYTIIPVVPAHRHWTDRLSALNPDCSDGGSVEFHNRSSVGIG